MGPPCGGPAQPPAQHQQPSPPEEHEQRDGRAEVERDVEREVVRELPAEELAGDDEVTGGGDGQEFRQALDDAEGGGAQQVFHTVACRIVRAVARVYWGGRLRTEAADAKERRRARTPSMASPRAPDRVSQKPQDGAPTTREKSLMGVMLSKRMNV